MARIRGVEPAEGGWFIRLVYRLIRRKMRALVGVGRVPQPLKILAHHPRLMRALGHMEMGQEAARSVPAALKSLASIKAAMLIGCPF